MFLCQLAAAETLPGKWLSASAPAGEGRDALTYKLYVPGSYRSTPLPLVVMLHGCLQSPESFAESTRMNGYAETGQFLVLYPAQNLSANPTRCWNWFLPKNQARDSGEPAQIVATVNEVAHQYAVDRKRVYVAGLSAGASMSAILAACYPDIFAGAAIHDGTMYKAATNFVGAEKVMLTGKMPDPRALAVDAWSCGGKRQLLVPVMILHGEGDNVVHRNNGELIVRQFSKLNDLADDGQENSSTPQQPTIEQGKVRSGYAYTVSHYSYRGLPLIEYYQIAEMGHAWSGGKDDLLFSDAKGPNASLLIWDFFKQLHR
jgi:poly(hydroxyalkanoate) depolymerase family esterase